MWLNHSHVSTIKGQHFSFIIQAILSMGPTQQWPWVSRAGWGRGLFQCLYACARVYKQVQNHPVHSVGSFWEPLSKSHWLASANIIQQTKLLAFYILTIFHRFLFILVVIWIYIVLHIFCLEHSTLSYQLLSNPRLKAIKYLILWEFFSNPTSLIFNPKGKCEAFLKLLHNQISNILNIF